MHMSCAILFLTAIHLQAVYLQGSKQSVHTPERPAILATTQHGFQYRVQRVTEKGLRFVVRYSISSAQLVTCRMTSG